MEKIIHLTDTHLFASGEGALRGTKTAATLSHVLAHLRRHHSDAQAILVTGDLVQEETSAAYEHFIEYFGGFSVPVLCLPGNHDVPDLLEASLSRPPFRLDAQVRLNGWDIMQLNSHLPGSAAGHVADSELQSLEARLKKNHRRPTLVAVHHPPIPVGTPWLDTVGLKNGQALLDLLTNHAHVKALIWGHAHQNTRRRHQHLELIGTPSTCAQFLPGSEGFAVDPDAPPAYRLLYLGDDGQIEDELVELPEAIEA
ncbi:Icc protein [Natronospira proteinivora]|uniref:Icc protein n=1 Tax=Natronospira proteinivora TaxID=1807133 RepID=A0ABT1G406_9GAMM|nr:phosphodiesterase [Natronospira proteinivora]MCP1726049.1 Icc protein [Natronospira proteinivora]